MNSQTNTIQTKVQPNKTTAVSVENISAMKRPLKIKTYQMTFHDGHIHSMYKVEPRPTGLTPCYTKTFGENVPIW